MSQFRLDRTKFKASSFENQQNDAGYYKSLTWKKRFEIAMYLNSIAYKLVGKGEPRMDKTVFSMR